MNRNAISSCRIVIRAIGAYNHVDETAPEGLLAARAVFKQMWPKEWRLAEQQVAAELVMDAYDQAQALLQGQAANEFFSEYWLHKAQETHPDLENLMAQFTAYESYLQTGWRYRGPERDH